MKKILFSFAFILSTLISFSQTDTTFWFAAPDNDVVNHPLYEQYDRPIYLRINSFSTSAIVTISIPANPTFVPIVVNIPANGTNTVDLTASIDLLENSVANTISNKGLLIKSTSSIAVYYEVNSSSCLCNPELFSLKGRNALGNEFYIPSQTTWSLDTVRHPDPKAAFDIVATTNNTTITITPSKPLIGRPANFPFTIILNKGQSFSCQGLYRNGPNLLNGSKVISDKPIAVTTKEDLSFADGLCADLAGDQLVPTSTLGKEFAIIKGNLTPRDKVIIAATQNNTNIFFNGSATAISTINSGQSYEYDLTTQPSLYIQTDKVVNILHYTGSGCELGAAVIPKLNCTGSSSVSLVRSNSGDAFVLIVTKNGNQNNFLVNGVAGIINSTDFSPLIGTGGNYVFCKKDITSAMPLNTAVKISNTSGRFQLGFLNGVSTGGNMYGYFSDFKQTNTSFSQAELCSGDSVQLNALGGVSYQWSPSTGLSNSSLANPKASPSATTNYLVVITTAEGCIDSSFVKVVVNNCANNICDNWLNTPSANTYAAVGDLDVSGNQITVEAIINRTSPYVGAYNYAGDIVSKHTNPTDANYLLRPNNGEITTSNGYFTTQPICDIQLNKTYHIALVYNGSTLKFYRNGFLMSQVAATGNLVQNNLITQFGHYNANFFNIQFLGFINEVRIWNVAKTQTELQTNMNTSLPNPTTQVGLLGYYTFDNLLNKQGNAAFNATLNGSTINNTNPNCTFVADSCNIILPGCTNIDSVRFTSTATSCTNFNFNGLGYTNTNPIETWQWNFGDGTNAVGQNTTHNYSTTNTYTVKLIIIDINVCKDSISKIITPSGINADAGLDTAFCTNTPITKILQGAGVGTYSWSPSLPLNNNTLQNPTATINGTTKFYLTVTNTLGCSALDSVTITINALPNVVTLLDTAICKNSNIILTTTGAISYTWLPAAAVSDPNIGSPTFIGNNTASLTVTGTDVNGCKSNDIVNITIKPIPVVRTLPDTAICANQNIILTTIGAQTYNWTPAVGLNNVSVASPIFSLNQNQTYIVNGFLNGCNANDTLNITVKQRGSFVAPSNGVMCKNEFAILNGNNGTNNIQYTWTPNVYLSNNNIMNPIATPPDMQQYNLLVKDLACLFDTNFLVKVVVNSLPTLSVTKSNDIVCTTPSAKLNVTGAKNYSWSPSTFLSNPNIANPITTPNATINYLVTGIDINGCKNIDSLKLNVSNAPGLFILPNTFTPNKDGINDCFGITKWGQLQNVFFIIYNRWGEKVFETNNPSICWNGKYKGEDAGVGSYVYYVSAISACGQIVRKGNILLIR